MAAKEWIVGYDAREMWNYNFEGMKVREPDSIFFFKPDVVKPLTVDSSIWGCLFNDGHYPQLSDAERQKIGLGTVKLPEWTGPNMPLWENLCQLEEYLALYVAELLKPYWIIAITGLIEDIEVKLSKEEWPHFKSTNPKDIDDSWRIVGYDINTREGECCLTGALHEGSETYIKSQQQRWGQYLNEYHLFNDINNAIEFRNVQNGKTPSDAPHFVYGIWLIKDIERL